MSERIFLEKQVRHYRKQNQDIQNGNKSHPNIRSINKTRYKQKSGNNGNSQNGNIKKYTEQNTTEYGTKTTMRSTGRRKVGKTEKKKLEQTSKTNGGQLIR